MTTTGASALAAELAAYAVPGRAEQERAYLKSDLAFLGTPVPAVRRVVAAHLRAHPELGHDGVVALARDLWSEPVHERRFAAVVVLGARAALLGPQDAALLEELLRQSGTWALVDTLATDAVATVVERHPGPLGPVLDRWAEDGDVWLRRAALLALLPPLRRGGGDFARFGRYADRLLEDPDPLLRKAIGWVLRDTGKARPELVRGWLLPRVGRASGLTLREAVRHLPPGDRAALLAAREEATSAR